MYKKFKINGYASLFLFFKTLGAVGWAIKLADFWKQRNSTMNATPNIVNQGDEAEVKGNDIRVMSLVGVAHFFSHFYIYLLPPLFPFLKTAFNVSYT